MIQLLNNAVVYAADRDWETYRLNSSVYVRHSIPSGFYHVSNIWFLKVILITSEYII